MDLPAPDVCSCPKENEFLYLVNRLLKNIYNEFKRNNPFLVLTWACSEYETFFILTDLQFSNKLKTKLRNQLQKNDF